MIGDDPTRFHDAIAAVVEEGLRTTFLHEPLNRETCMKIYTFIFNTVLDVLSTANMQVSNDFINYVAQQFYAAIEINGRDDQLDPNIFTQKTRLEDVKTVELHLLAMLFRGTDGFSSVFAELRRRN